MVKSSVFMMPRKTTDTQCSIMYGKTKILNRALKIHVNTQFFPGYMTVVPFIRLFLLLVRTPRDS